MSDIPSLGILDSRCNHRYNSLCLTFWMRSLCVGSLLTVMTLLYGAFGLADEMKEKS
jgi:hypothetical protein